jgi:hypothetical protein
MYRHYSYVQGDSFRRTRSINLEEERATYGMSSRSLLVIKSIVEEDSFRIDPKSDESMEKALLNAIKYKAYYPMNIITYLANNGARLSATFIETAYVSHIRDSLRPVRWTLRRMFLKHGAYLDRILQRNDNNFNGWGAWINGADISAKERQWFKDFASWRYAFAVEIGKEIKIKADQVYYTPPIEIRAGFIVPGRQGYLDSLENFTLSCEEKK